LISLLFYNLGIRLYYLAAYVASFFSPKAKSWIDGRKKVHHRLGNYTSSAHGKRIWFHCASLGEFEQVRPLIEKIRLLHPDHKLILTFFSPSGFDARRYYDGVDFVGYLPLDTPYDAKKFIRRMKPSLVIWVKYEFWYHMLSELHEQHIPVVLVSATFRPGHVFFQWYGALHRSMLGYFTHIFVQNKASQLLLQTLGIASDICADTRFDSVYNVMQRHKQLDNIAAMKGDKKLLIAGSTWTKDADILCELINNAPFEGRFKYIIAPHDVSWHHLEYLIKRINKKKALLSRVKIQNAEKFEVIIVDSIGLLSSLYYYGDMAYVGGGFNASIHNILEPAVYGMPVFFGPNYQKSEEAKEMLSHPDWHAAISIKNYTDLLEGMQSLLDNKEENLQTGSAKSKGYVLNNRGGTDHIYLYLSENNLI
jgi:3-deoxy-D-manno-octulosonic-acid transferase